MSLRPLLVLGLLLEPKWAPLVRALLGIALMFRELRGSGREVFFLRGTCQEIADEKLPGTKKGPFYTP